MALALSTGHLMDRARGSGAAPERAVTGPVTLSKMWPSTSARLPAEKDRSAVGKVSQCNELTQCRMHVYFKTDRTVWIRPEQSDPECAAWRLGRKSRPGAAEATACPPVK